MGDRETETVEETSEEPQVLLEAKPMDTAPEKVVPKQSEEDTLALHEIDFADIPEDLRKTMRAVILPKPGKMEPLVTSLSGKIMSISNGLNSEKRKYALDHEEFITTEANQLVNRIMSIYMPSKRY